MVGPQITLDIFVRKPSDGGNYLNSLRGMLSGWHVDCRLSGKAWDNLTMIMASYLHLLVWLDKAGMFMQLIWGLRKDHTEKLLLDTKITTTIRHNVTLWVALVRISGYHMERQRERGGERNLNIPGCQSECESPRTVQDVKDWNRSSWKLHSRPLHRKIKKSSPVTLFVRQDLQSHNL